MKKYLPLLLALLFMLSLSSCVHPTQQSIPDDDVNVSKEENSEANIDAIHNYKMELNMDVKMSIGSLAGDVGLNIGLKSDADIFTDPVRAKMVTSVSAMGQETVGEYVAIQNGESFDLYSSEDGVNWEKESADINNLPVPVNMKTHFSELGNVMESFQETGEEEVRGVVAIVYSGTIAGENMNETIKAAGMGNLFSNEFGPDAESIDIASLGVIPTTIAVERETGRIVRYTIDMSEIIKSLMDMSVAAGYKDESSENYIQNAGEIGFGIKIEKADLVIDLFDYNQADEIIAPTVG